VGFENSYIESILKISLIIPTYNGEAKLPSLFASLEQQEGDDFEIIVVVDGSSDQSLEFLQFKRRNGQFPNLQIISQTNKGRAGARNVGARSAKGEILLFLDDDMALSSGVVMAHVAHHMQNCDSILVGNQLENPKLAASDFQRYKAALSSKWMSNLATNKQVISNPFITAAHFSIQKLLFQKVGMFDESLTDAEDFDFAVRAQSAKVPIYFDPSLVGWHMEVYSCKSFILRQRQYTQAAKHLYRLRNNESYIPPVETISLWRRKLLGIFAHSAWVSIIDSGKMEVVPEFLRYRFYSLVVTSLGSVHTNVPLS